MALCRNVFPRPLAVGTAVALALAMLVAPGCSNDTDGHAHASGEAHGHAALHAPAGDFPVPDGHTPWAPDAPLVEGMSRVRTAVAALDDQADEATVAASAAEVDAAVDYMFANCSLPTEPDVALHAILARLMAATQALRADPGDLAAVADMRAAIANYEVLFADPAR